MPGDFCASAPEYGFSPVKYRGSEAYSRKIDDNFKLVLIPHPRTMDYLLTGDHGRILHHGLVTADGPGDPVVRVVQEVEEHMSRTGTMYTYGSINLKTATGIGPLTGAPGKGD